MKLIAWDVDDTLNDLMREWLEKWFLPRNRRCRAAYSGLRDNPPHKALGISLDAYLRSYDEFRLSAVYDELPPSPEALAWFRRSGSRYRHIAVTAVPLAAAHRSAGWIYRHFGRWIRTFHIVPSPRKGQALPRYEATKAGFLKSIGGCGLFVDDSPRNVRQAAAAGLRSALVPRPWNRAPGTPAEFFRSLK